MLMVIQDEGTMYDYSAISAIDKVFGEYMTIPYRGSLAGIGYTGPDEVPWRLIKTGRSRLDKLLRRPLALNDTLLVSVKSVCIVFFPGGL